MNLRSISCCLACAPLTMAASAPVHLAPASKWVLDYADDSCRLIRTFGDPAAPSVLLFERASPISPMSMLVIGTPFRTGSSSAKLTARFTPPVGLAFEDGQGATAPATKQPAILWPSVGFYHVEKMGGSIPDALKKAMESVKRGERPPPTDLAKVASGRAEAAALAAQVSAIEITPGHRAPVILDTGTMGRAVSMLNDCTRNQLRGWGVDPDVEDKIVRRPWTASPGNWFSSSDYPSNQFQNGQESLIEARLLVDATGRPTKCTSLTHVNGPEFSKAVCDAFMKRANFAPAELADGTKVPSYYVQTVHFKMYL